MVSKAPRYAFVALWSDAAREARQPGMGMEVAAPEGPRGTVAASGSCSYSYQVETQNQPHTPSHKYTRHLSRTSDATIEIPEKVAVVVSLIRRTRSMNSRCPPYFIDLCRKQCPKHPRRIWLQQCNSKRKETHD